MAKSAVDLAVVFGLAGAPGLPAPCEELLPGPVGDARLAALGHPAVVVSGVLVRSVLLARREGALLHTAGDVLPGGGEEPEPFRERWRVLTPIRLAVLDRPALWRAAAVPEVMRALAAHLALGRDRSSLQAILVQLSSIEERLTALLPELSQRVGVVTADGVTLPAYLSHTVLAALIGVRRPSLTTALRALEAAGTVRRLPDRRWVIAPQVAGLAAA
jgi:CRP/FNR family cyclic AMP-dependent transcriptional regulator